MNKFTFIWVLSLLSCCTLGQKYASQHKSKNGYQVQSKEESNHYEVNHYEYEHKPYPYRFGYDIKDEKGNVQYHKEEGDEYNVKKGSYGFTDAYGIYRHVDYIADHMGFRAKIRTNEPGTASYHPAHVSIYSEPPPSHVYSAYDKSAHSSYGQQQHETYDDSAHDYFENTVQQDKSEHRGYVKADDHNAPQQNDHEENYTKLDTKFSYVPVYVSNKVEEYN